MEHDYEYIVNEWYTKLWPRCERVLARACPSLSLEDARDTYQNAFIAVYENIANNRVSEDTNWDSYIIRICVNLGCKTLRKVAVTDSISGGEGKDSTEMAPVGINSRLALSIFDDEQKPLCDDIEAQAILGYELAHTPEPCSSIVRMFYYGQMPMEEIAEELGMKNAATAKSRKSQCMTDLIKRVTKSLQRAGFDVKPKKRNPNGKN